MSSKGEERVGTPQRHGRLFVISGPSGAGKTSICHEILGTVPGVTQSISCTTRAPRSHEQDGREYFFVDRETFEQHVKDDAFLEWAHVHDHLYGTLREPVEQLVATGRDVLLAIDVQGGASLRAASVDAVLVYILPPDLEALEARLQHRGSESPEVRQRRLAVARQELAHYTHYDYVVYNDQLATAVEMFRNIIIAERHRISRVGTAPVDALLQQMPVSAGCD